MKNDLSELPELPDAPKETLFEFIRRAYRSNRTLSRIFYRLRVAKRSSSR